MGRWTREGLTAMGWDLESGQKSIEGIPDAPKSKRRNRREEGELQARVVKEFLIPRGVPFFSNNNGAHLGAGHYHLRALIGAILRDPDKDIRTLRMLQSLVVKMESAKHGERTRLQQQGLSVGTPDLWVPVPKFDVEGLLDAQNGYGIDFTNTEYVEIVRYLFVPFAVCELKVGRNGLTTEQEWWKKYIESINGRYILGRTFKRVVEELEDHLS